MKRILIKIKPRKDGDGLDEIREIIERFNAENEPTPDFEGNPVPNEQLETKVCGELKVFLDKLDEEARSQSVIDVDEKQRQKRIKLAEERFYTVCKYLGAVLGGVATLVNLLAG